MAAIPDIIISGALSGDALVAFFIKNIGTIRLVASLRTKDQIPKDSIGAAALRYLGAQVMALAPKVRSFLVTTLPTGALSGLGFNLVDFDKAVTRVADAHEADTTLSVLAKDAHGEAVAAMQTLAAMLLSVVQSYLGTLKLKSADPHTKATFKAAGAKLEVTLAQIAEVRKGSKITNADLKTQAGTIGTQEEQIKQYQTEAVVQKVQDELKLQSLTGEPLRPKDLVMADVPTDSAAQATPGYGRKPAAQHKTFATPAAPTAGKARRKSPR